MTSPNQLQRMLYATVCILSLSACASAPKVAALDQVLAQATQASTAGQGDKAMALWKQAAAAYPADKAPWVQMAQTKYAAGQYGEAIINAQEVLVRDPNDKLANSIVAISGLRLSTRALADLSRQNNLSGPLRTESQDLAKLLRESLGETVLVPSREKAAPARAVTRRASPSKAADDSSANPFDALK